MTARRVKQTETQFQESVIEAAHTFGWRVAHFRAARTADGSWRTPVQADGRGFPDLVLVRDRVIFAELKSDTGKVSDEQHEWIAWLEGAGAQAEVWRPADWPLIEATLRG